VPEGRDGPVLLALAAAEGVYRHLPAAEVSGVGAQSMNRLLSRWVSYLLEPVDAASTAVFRIVFGAMVAWDMARYLANGWIDEYYILPKIHFTYLYLDFVRPWPGQWMYVHFAVTGLAALAVALGLFYRFATVLLFVTYSYIFLLEESVYMNHYYLIALLAFLLIWIPADREFSFDMRRKAHLPRSVPRWCVLLLRFQLFIVYFYGAIAKLNPDWLAGEPMYSEILRHGSDVPRIAYGLPAALLAYAIAYGGIAIDASVPILLSFRRTRRFGFAFAFVFHALNEVFLNIGVFSYLMTGAITIFFDPDWPRQLWRRLRGEAPAAVVSPARSPHSRRRHLGLAAVHLYVLWQLIFPLRHFILYPGNVSWTEEGHRFAWQMKLRKKRSRMTIHVTDPASGRQWTIDPSEDLRPRQLRKLETFPDILLQYVHYHRDLLRARGIDPIITVDWQCSLNGGPYLPLVDPSVNLAAVERSWRHAPWLLLRDGTARAEKAQAQKPQS
jgi:HTTM domain/Vitamin K-dependent gamma-carboxylase, lumenal domain